MLSLRIDRFEFEDPASEQMLEIDISRQSKYPFPDAESFVREAVSAHAAANLAESRPFYMISGRAKVSEYLKRFANIEVPLHADWATYLMAEPDWDQVHLVICAPGVFIRYHWSTSA